ncbi:MAG TPA: hypothetical protein VF230_03225 [Acidimicrobiales bacterium]
MSPAIASPAQAVAGVGSTTILATYELRGGKVLTHFADAEGIGWAVVKPGTVITTEEIAIADGPVNALAIRPPEPITDQEARAAIAQLRNSGWTEQVQLELLDLVSSGVSPLRAIDLVEPSRVAASSSSDPTDLDSTAFHDDCAERKTGTIEATGCFARKWGDETDTHRYIGAETWGLGWSTTHEARRLRTVTVAHSYANGGIVKLNPLTGRPIGSCTSAGIQLGGHGVELKLEHQICPTEIYVTLAQDRQLYGVDWRGSVYDVGEQRASELLEIMKRPNGTGTSGYTFHLFARAEPVCDECNSFPGIKLLP